MLLFCLLAVGGQVVRDAGQRVLIIGAGPAGIAVAAGLLKRGIPVMLVDAGGETNNPRLSKDFNGKSHRLALTKGIKNSRYYGLGGTSQLWGGGCNELDEEDFCVRDWIHKSGWPISKRDLLAYYEEAAIFLDLDIDTIRSPSRIGLKEIQGFDLTGLAYAPHPMLKQMISMLTDRYKDKITVLQNTRLVDLVIGSDSVAVKGAILGAIDGSSTKITADFTVLCLGGIETARLLMHSFHRQGRMCGQGDRHLGRYFCEHPIAPFAELKDWEANNVEQYEVQSNFVKMKVGGRYTPYYRLPFKIQQQNSLVNAVIQITYHEPQLRPNELAAFRLYRALRDPHEFPIRFSDAFRSCLAVPSLMSNSIERRRLTSFQPDGRRLSNIGVRYQIEQVPSSNNRVLLTRDKDSFGVLKTRLDWSIGTSEYKTTDFIKKYTMRCLSLAGIGKVKPYEESSIKFSTLQPDLRGGVHHCGTTRMSHSPNDGVVDQNLKIHGLKGIYLCSSSVFPTNGWVNPTFSIMAIGFRLSEHISSLKKSMLPL